MTLRVNRRWCSRQAQWLRSTKRVLIVVLATEAAKHLLISFASPQIILRATSTTRPFSRRFTTWAYNQFGRGRHRRAG